MSIMTSRGNLTLKKQVGSTLKFKEKDSFIFLPFYAITLVETSEPSKRSTLISKKVAGYKS
jgi:hypothetical protein